MEAGEKRGNYFRGENKGDGEREDKIHGGEIVEQRNRCRGMETPDARDNYGQ